MKKALLLSTIVAVGGAFAATGAKAQTGSYTFTNYCDGITGGVVTGSGALSATHNYYGCYGTNNYNGLFGGFPSHIAALGGGTWYGLTNVAYTAESVVYVYYTKFPTGRRCRGGEWVGFYESTVYGITYSEFNSGGLSCGYAAEVGVQRNPTTRDAALRKAKLIK